MLTVPAKNFSVGYWLRVFSLASIAFGLPIAASAQQQTLQSTTNSNLEAGPTDQQLKSIWNDYFRHPRYYMANDGNDLMSQFCLSAGTISAPKSNAPLILLDLKVIFRRPLNEVPNQPDYQVSMDQPHYLFLFKVTFPNQDHNLVYQMWLRDGNIKAQYIGIGLNANLQSLENSISMENIFPAIEIFVYANNPQNTKIANYDKIISSPVMSFGASNLSLPCS